MRSSLLLTNEYIMRNYFEFIHFRHGEKVAGVIAGALNNSECGVGLAYEAKLGGRVIDITFFIT